MNRIITIVGFCLSVSVTIAWRPPVPRVFLIGDSTMANKKDSDRPETGWAEKLPGYFHEGIVFYNHAVNCRSTKSCRNMCQWEDVFNQLQKNDYVIIQFGHNDSKKDDPERYAEANTDYKKNLENYIKEIRSNSSLRAMS